MPAVIEEFLAFYPDIFLNDFLRYVIGTSTIYLIVHVMFARALAGRVIGERTLQPGQLRRELTTSLRTVFVFTLAGSSIWFGVEFDILPFYRDPAELGWGWFWGSVVILILAHDAWFYWTHYLLHHPKLFKRWHRIHHLSRQPTPFAAYAFDVEEALINAAFMVLIGAIMPISFLAMFLFTAHMMLRNAMGHCGVELFPARRDGRPLFDWMTTVTHHDMHHERADGNFGLYFTFWDRIMGTEQKNYHARFKANIRSL